MDAKRNDYIMYRLKQAKEFLDDSEFVFQNGRYKTSLNRSYYAVFHAMRAVNGFDEYDSTKHSGVISYFRQHFIKEGKLDVSLSKIISTTSRFREKSDYNDFYIASKTDAKEQLEHAEFFVSKIEQYIEKRLREEDIMEEAAQTAREV